MDNNTLLMLAGAFGGGCLLGGLLIALHYRAREKLLTQQLPDRFRSLAAEALKETSAQAQATANHDLELRQLAIEHLVKPLKDSVEKLENLTRGDNAALKQHLELVQLSQDKLGKETAKLSQALRSSQGRGRWGEQMLRTTVEMAGMTERIDFDAQVTYLLDDQRVRPDLVVRLPDNKRIIIDAKAPIDAYLNALDADDETVRLGFLKRHAVQVRDQVTLLGKKSYWQMPDSGTTPEFVVLFLPGEDVFRAALQQDPDLLDTALDHRVVLASPLTLIAMLKAVDYAWRQNQLAENARVIAAVGKELHSRLMTFTEHFSAIGKGLGGAIGKFNDAVGSFQTRVMPAARKFEDMSVNAASDTLEDLRPVDLQPREISSELTLESARALGTRRNDAA
jgi:DNA recombination protein RmuC